MVRLVLFDIDGTLIQSGGAGEIAFGRVCELEFGIPNGTAGLNFAGRTDPSIVREFFQHHDIKPSPQNFQRFFDCYVFMLDHLLGRLNGRVLGGVPEMLRQLEAMPKPPLVGLLTGNILLGARLKLGHYQLWDSFAMGAFGDDDEDRNRVAAVAKKRGSRLLGKELDGDQILVIGDTPKDIECAQAIDARCIAVATGKFTTKELASHAPTWTVESLSEVSVEAVCG